MLGLRHERSTLPTSASNHRIRPASSGSIGKGLDVQIQRAGQEVHRQIEPGARAQQVLHLLIRLADRQRRIHVDRGEVGHRQVERA